MSWKVWKTKRDLGPQIVHDDYSEVPKPEDLKKPEDGKALVLAETQCDGEPIRTLTVGTINDCATKCTEEVTSGGVCKGFQYYEMGAETPDVKLPVCILFSEVLSFVHFTAGGGLSAGFKTLSCMIKNTQPTTMRNARENKATRNIPAAVSTFK